MPPAECGAAPARPDEAAGARPSASAPPRDVAPVIVGVGGSAGSLTPLRQLLRALPADSEMAFVVVSHQAPTGQSLLPEILAKATVMPVCEIAGETRALPNHVYVVPRGHSVAVHNGVLVIEPIGEPSRVPMPIDAFFQALARDRGHRAVGIILSGTGRDGTLGLAAIRAESGFCLAQDPATAEFDGMPGSAIAAQVTDYALPVGEMPARLIAYARSVGAPEHEGEPSEATSREMERIVAVIRASGGHDFAGYKRGTLLRRVERRMALHRIESVSDYARYLKVDDEEIDALWRDWLIGVSSFFRDPEAFLALAESALPPLLAARAADRRLRIWVPGCATGEEAYSIAIVVFEALEAVGGRLDVQVFATDLDPSAIQTARAGLYPKAIAEAIGKRRLERYFVEEPRGYRAKNELRDRIVFAVQDVLHDPPFTRVDLISCRNVLIYLVPSAQETLLSIFHYSLNPGGLLLLGASEYIGPTGELFAAVDKRWKLFRRNDSVVARPPLRWAPRVVAAPSRSAVRPAERLRLKPSKEERRPKRAELEQDLQDVRRDLDLSVSDLQAANEELASANEEVQSANEELQSSNEELQTSKEETQSLNEELQTVNAELVEKLRGLEQANDDLLNLMSSIEIATIFLDDRLRVKRFTPQARSVTRLIDSDMGRPLADLAILVDYPDLIADAESVLASLRPLEKQVRGPGGVWYAVRIRPYRTGRNAVEGLVVNFIDITETKRAELGQAARMLAENIVDSVHEPLLVLDPILRVTRANRSFYRAFGLEPAEVEGRPLAELGSGQWSIPRLLSLLEATLRDGTAFEDLELVRELPEVGRRRMILSGRPVSMEGNERPVLLVLGIQEVPQAPVAIPGEDVEA